jgi:hypothetical protein
MDISLIDFPWYKRWSYIIAGKNIIPTIVSAIGFAYIAIPEKLQITIRQWAPDFIRDHMLMLWTSETWLIVLLIISVFCLIWGGLGSNVTASLVKRKFKELFDLYKVLEEESDSKSINCYRLFSNWLYSYSEHLNLSTNERVSLYKLDMDLFSCIGRYSENEIFNSKPNRLYPRDQGGISRAWEVGVFEDTSAPDPSVNMDDWINHNVREYNFTEDELINIRMKSRAFYGVRLKNSSNTTVAVVLFESLSASGLPFGKIKKLLNEKETKNLVALVDSLSGHIPNLESAKEEGF